jgi:site-specific recombinase XerD
MKTTEPRVNVRIDTTKKRKDGLSPLYIHIQWEGTRVKESTGIYCTPEDFRRKKYRLDRRLKKRLEEIEERVDELMSSHKPFTAKDCVGKPERKMTPDMVVTEMCRVKRLADKTVAQYRTAIWSLKQYFGEDFTLDELDLGKIQGYARTMRVSPSSMCSYLKCLNSVLNYAVDKGYVPDNPMVKWSWKGDGYKPTDKPRAIGKGDITVIINTYRTTTDKPLKEAAAVWLAGYFFNGLAVVDLVSVDWSSLPKEFINGGWYYNFHIHRRKTKEMANVMTPVTPLTKSLVEFMKTSPWNGKKHYGDYINYHLKKIDPQLTYYQCRHSFASYMVNSGMPVNVVATMMGRSVNGIATYINRVTEKDVLGRAAEALKRTEIPETPPEDIWLTD